MKAMTCASYEYMKVTVEDLKRRLAEIEGTGSSSPNKNPMTPKPPPRRHNPFNRPAPSPPNTNPNSQLNNNSQSNNNHQKTTQNETTSSSVISNKQTNSANSHLPGKHYNF